MPKIQSGVSKNGGKNILKTEDEILFEKRMKRDIPAPFQILQTSESRMTTVMAVIQKVIHLRENDFERQASKFFSNFKVQVKILCLINLELGISGIS